MSAHNISFKAVIWTTKAPNCALIGVCAVIRLNMVEYFSFISKKVYVGTH